MSKNWELRKSLFRNGDAYIFAGAGSSSVAPGRPVGRFVVTGKKEKNFCFGKRRT